MRNWMAVILVGLLAGVCGAKEVTLSGRVIDQDGKGVPDARIVARGLALGANIQWAEFEMLRTLSDADGKFALTLPYDGVRYLVGCEKMAWSNANVSVVADQNQAIEMKIIRGAWDHHLEGHIAGAAHLPITLMGEFGFVAKTATDADGGFSFTGLPEYFGQGVIIGGANGKVIPLVIVHPYDKKNWMSTALVDPATFKGTITEKQTHKPLTDVVVRLHPSFATDFELQSRTDEKGNWEIKDAPPGEYQISTESTDHFDMPPRGYSTERQAHSVAGGQTVTVDLEMERSPVISGDVVDVDGKGVEGAMVCTLVTCDGDYRNQNRWVMTDAQGHFEIVTGHAREQLTLEAAHGNFGLGHATVKPMAAGEMREGVHIKLPGVARFKGQVVGPDGEGVVGAKCTIGWTNNVEMMTDEQGRFDEGLVTLGAGEGQLLMLVDPPRPQGGNSLVVADSGGMVPEKQPELMPKKYYQPTRQSLTPKPGQTIDVKIGLKATDLLAITGQLVDLAGKPLAKSSVHLFAGSPDDTWINMAVPVIDNTVRPGPQELAGGETDARGKFRVYVVRSEGQAADGGTCFSIGIVSNNQAHKLVKVIVPMDKREAELKVDVDPAIKLEAKQGGLR